MKEWGNPLFCLHYEVKRLAAKRKAAIPSPWCGGWQSRLRDLGLMLWDVRFVKEGADWFLRIFYRNRRIGIEDCEAMSVRSTDRLMSWDPVEQSYCLEVCSPG